MNNTTADKFQNALGFERTGKDECAAIKTLSVQKFNESAIVKRFTNTKY